MTHPSGAPISLPGPHNIVTAKLSNGLTAYVYENFASQTVVVEASLYGGSICERPEQAGLADLLTSVMRRGAAGRSFDQINDAVESVGAMFGFDTGRHSISFDAKCMPADLDLILDLLAEALTQPDFPPDQIEQVRALMLTSIQERQHSPRSMAHLTFMELAYPDGHTYGRALSGYEHTITPLTRTDLIDYYRRFVGPGGGVVVIVGAIAAADAIARLERTLGQWRQPATPVLDSLHRPVVHEKIERHIDVPGKSQTDIVLGWIGIDRQHPDFFPVLLCNTILGRFGMGGRLGYNVRERQGMAYYASSSFQAGQSAGPWMAMAGVNPTNVDQTVRTILHEIDRIRTEAVTDEEWTDVRTYLTGSLPLAIETNSGLADNILNMTWNNLGLDFLLNYANAIYAVSKNDIQRVAQTYLDPEAYILAVAGPPTT